ncbi:uncharacterized protein JCM10292_001066 [Rhodotorula paludigena]|uniref:uncharacterized protein n=1 Tax=Rhodotorula paludigena TaxID=86838 RepID=UPI00318282FB
MQVEAAPSAPASAAGGSPPFAHAGSPQASASRPPPVQSASLSGYSFPTAADSPQAGRLSPSPPSHFTAPRSQTESHFSFGSAPHHGGQNHLDAASPAYLSHERREEYERPRSLSIAALLAGQGSAPSHSTSPGAAPAHEYSALTGRIVAGGGPPRPGLSGYTSDYYAVSQPASYDPSYFQAPSLAQPQPQTAAYSLPASSATHPFALYRPFSFGTAPSAPAHPLARALYGPSASSGLEWAKPRGSTDDATAMSRQYAAQALSRSMPAPAYYTPSHPSGLMIRSTSNQSGLSSYSEQSADSSAGNCGGSGASDYEGHHVNPAFVSGADSGYYSSPQLDKSVTDLSRSNSADLRGVSGLRIDSSPAAETPAMRPKPFKAASESTIRGLRVNRSNVDTIRAAANGGSPGPVSSSASSSSGANRLTRRRINSTIFHPPPQAMLAPGSFSPSGSAIGARRKADDPSKVTPLMPTDDEFAKLPTKRSRGRVPPVSSKLKLDGVNPDAGPTEEQIAYVGTTKSGRAKKIFLCKVPGCGKCFKRSEHLKRHIRSIHTNEKPFMCQWPNCNRFFSRHDNLNQHLRVHREPGMSDAQFSAALADCFGKRLAEVQREKAWQRPGQSDSEDGGEEPAPDNSQAQQANGETEAGQSMPQHQQGAAYDAEVAYAAVFGTSHQHHHGGYESAPDGYYGGGGGGGQEGGDEPVGADDDEYFPPGIQPPQGRYALPLPPPRTLGRTATLRSNRTADEPAAEPQR